MTDLFASLVDRALDRMPVLQRRQPTLFEPVATAAFSEKSKPGNVSTLDEQEMLVESSPRAQEQRHFNRNTAPQPSSRLEESETETIEAPRARPRRVHESRQPQTDQDNDRSQPAALSSVKEQAIRPQAPPSHEGPVEVAKHKDLAIMPPREIETIVERRVEREIVKEHSTDKPAIKEVQTLSAPQSQSKPVRANHDVEPSQPSKAESKPVTPKEQTILKPSIQNKPAPPTPTPRIVQAASRFKPNDNTPAPATPIINVTIGRVEVRATSQTPPKPQRVQPAGPKTSLEDYLRSRGKGN